LTATIKKLWKNEYFQTAIVITIIILIVLSFWYGPQLILGTSVPIAVVPSGSMCIPYGRDCDGWTHPFDRTLHVGDIILIQGVNPRNLNTNYPDSDVIIFRRPDDPSVLIVHRIVAVQEINRKLYFTTKGDGNSVKDYWVGSPDGAVSEDMVVGKLLMRIPWIGHIPLFVNDVAKQLGIENSNIGVTVIVLLIILLIIVEFILPIIRGKRAPVEHRKTAEPQAYRYL
jgi:signal peptidase I